LQADSRRESGEEGGGSAVNESIRSTLRRTRDPLDQPNPFSLPEDNTELFRQRDENAATLKTVGRDSEKGSRESKG
jgi:hypothetical protein